MVQSQNSNLCITALNALLFHDTIHFQDGFISHTQKDSHYPNLKKEACEQKQEFCHVQWTEKLTRPHEFCFVLKTTCGARCDWNWQLCHSEAFSSSAWAVFIHVFFSASLPCLWFTCQPHCTTCTWWDVIASPLKCTQSSVATALIKNTCLCWATQVLFFIYFFFICELQENDNNIAERLTSCELFSLLSLFLTFSAPITTWLVFLTF